MTRTDRLALCVGALALAACSAAEPGAPRPTAIAPAYGFTASATAVEVRGDAFAVKPVQSVDGDRSRVESAYRAWIGGTELGAVTWLEAGRLSAVVPAGLPAGTHDVVVEGPFGQGVLPGGFRVIDGAPPALRVALEAPGRVSVGQRFAIAAHVTNDGSSALDAVTPSLSPGALLVVLAPPAVASAALAPGDTASFGWTVEAIGSGEAAPSVDAAAVDPRLPSEPVRAADARAVPVQERAQLEAALEAVPTPLNEGQELRLRLTVRNSGEATAAGVAPGPLGLSGDGTAAPVSGPTPVATDLAGGATATFEWRLAASRHGALRVDVEVAGADGNSGTAVGATAGADARVLRPAALSVPRLAAARARVNVGQAFQVELDVANAGESGATGVAADVSASAAALATGTPPGPFDLSGGSSATVSRTFVGAATGTAAIGARLTGVDATDGREVTATATDVAVAVEQPAALAATLAMPASLSLQLFTVSMTVTNTGDATATGVVPGAIELASGSTASARLVSGPAGGAASIPGGGSATFAWTYRTETVGTLELAGSVAAVDANDGGGRVAQAPPVVADVRDEPRVLSPDPFPGDGTSFAPDVVASNVSSNSARPFASIGYTGCQENSPANACGPDNENGRGLLTSVRFGGEEWLLVGGARTSGDLDYVYLSRGAASPLAFWYVDLSDALGGNTRGFSAALVASDRLYLGFPDNGGNRPYGLALLAPPAAPGRDAVLGTDVLDLNLAEAFKKTGGGYASVTMVDAMAELNGRIYLFADPGCIVSTTATPATKDDFVTCSPPFSPQYDEDQSIEPTRQHDLEPYEKAWPQVAVWRGRLYAIRNTYDGPQLWRCDLEGGLYPAVCEPGDWALVAGDAANLTRFGYGTATAASLLVATPAHLYVGLDDATRGIHVFRTDADRPELASAFTGLDGCTAGVTGCQGYGRDGLGEPAVLQRIFDADAIASPDGRADVYLTAGNGSSAVRVIALPQ